MAERAPWSPKPQLSRYRLGLGQGSATSHPTSNAASSWQGYDQGPDCKAQSQSAKELRAEDAGRGNTNQREKIVNNNDNSNENNDNSNENSNENHRGQDVHGVSSRARESSLDRLLPPSGTVRCPAALVRPDKRGTERGETTWPQPHRFRAGQPGLGRAKAAGREDETLFRFHSGHEARAFTPVFGFSRY